MMTLAELLNCVSWEHLTIRKELVEGDYIVEYTSTDDIPEKYLNARVNENEFRIYQDGLMSICVVVGLLWI